jgi:hypothetical protein
MNDFTLGQHTAQIRALQDDLTEVKSDVKQILATMSEIRGGRKVAGWVAAGVSAVISFIIARVFG